MTAAPPPAYHRLTIAALLVAAVVTVAYWVVWFGIDCDALASATTSEYFVFENAFPAADAWLAVACLASAWSMRRRSPAAPFWLVAAGSAALYLGLLDVLFDVENAMYLAPRGDWGAVAIELVINVYSFGLGAWAMRFGWKNREWFSARRT